MKLFVTLVVIMCCVQLNQAGTWWRRLWRRARASGHVSGGYGPDGWYVEGGVVIKFSRDHCDAATHLITRDQWGARDVNRQAPGLEISPVKHIFVYETGPCKPNQSERDCVRDIQAADLRAKKDDIGYNFLVGKDGTIYEGRGWDTAGQHDPKIDSESLGFGFLGSFSKVEPSLVSQEALYTFIVCGKNAKKVVSKKAMIHPGQGLGEAFLSMLFECEGLCLRDNVNKN